jgi:hypothetical protein
MPIGPAIMGVVVSILFFFIALVLYDAIGTNVADCGSFTDGNATNACESMKQYAAIVFTIAPIAILLDVFGVIPLFGGRFSAR